MVPACSFGATTTPSGYVEVVSRNSGQPLDVYGALLDDLEFASDDGAGVIQYTPHGGANQQWLHRPVESTAAPVTTRERTVSSRPALRQEPEASCDSLRQ